MGQESERKNRISNRDAILLIVSAIIADLCTVIPIVGIIVGPAYWALVNFYFWKSGLGFVNNGRLATSAISAVAELIPVIQELPTISVGMIIIVVMSRIEDKTGISVSSVMSGPHLNSGGSRKPTPKTAPLNQDGKRAPNGGLGA